MQHSADVFAKQSKSAKRANYFVDVVSNFAEQRPHSTDNSPIPFVAMESLQFPFVTKSQKAAVHKTDLLHMIAEESYTSSFSEICDVKVEIGDIETRKHWDSLSIEELRQAQRDDSIFSPYYLNPVDKLLTNEDFR